MADQPADAVVLEATATETPTVEAPAAPTIPLDQARIVVNNGFDQEVRFTLDQQYRVELNNLSGEWDLKPGDSISILVYPGTIPFSVSTPWRGIAGNAEVIVDKNQERSLWLYFVQDPNEKDRWDLQY